MTGDKPLTYQPPVIEIEGREYTLRRLGMLDIQRLARIYAGMSAYINRAALANIENLTPKALGTFLIDAMAYAIDEVIDFLAFVLGVPPGKADESVEENEGTFRDSNLFPIGSESKIIEALIGHEDVVAFFGSVTNLANSPALKKLTKRLKKRSTGSKADTDGKTKTS